MQLTIDDIVTEVRGLPLIPLPGITAYQGNIPLLKKHVDETLSVNPAIHKLIGHNPLQILYDNHSHHAQFMATVFTLGSYELLARVIPWVYRTYSAHHFSFDYFLLELNAWVEAIEKHISADKTAEIRSVYSWMIERHEDMIRLSASVEESDLPIRADWLERKNVFLAALLEGNHRKCLEIAEESILTGKDIELFYLHIIQSVMYEIGILWERGTISVAVEHLASAIVGRVMASTSRLAVAPKKGGGKVVITSAPNEFHEIGAWMISDILEHDGWEVRYLGANTPVNDLLDLLGSFRPNVLALSVTMPFNIIKAKSIIDSLRENEFLKKIKVVIGGRVFNETPELWRSTGADFSATNVLELKQLLHTIKE